MHADNNNRLSCPVHIGHIPQPTPTVTWVQRCAQRGRYIYQRDKKVWTLIGPPKKHLYNIYLYDRYSNHNICTLLDKINFPMYYRIHLYSFYSMIAPCSLEQDLASQRLEKPSLIFSHLKLWLATAIHNFKWLKMFCTCSTLRLYAQISSEISMITCNYYCGVSLGVKGLC